MRAALAVAKATFVLYLRDRTTIALTLLLTGLMMVVFGTVGAQPEMKLPVAVWNQAGAAGETFVQRLRERDRVTVAAAHSLAEVQAAVERSQAVAGLIVRPTFPKEGARGVELVVAADPSAWTRLGVDLLTHVVNDVATPAEPIPQRRLGPRRDRYIDFIFPGILAMSIMQASFPVGLFLLDTRRRGILRRFRLAPRSVAPFLAGLVASRLLVTTVNLLALGALAAGAFGVRIAGSWVDLAAAVLLGSAVFVSVGVFIATVAPSTESGAMLIQLFSLTMSFLCGVFFKLDQIPSALRWLPEVLPLTYLADVLRGVANTGTSLGTDPMALAVLGAWLTVPLLASGLLFRRFLEGE